MDSLALRNTVKHTWAVAVAAPALVYAGYRHPGTLRTRVLLGLTGVTLFAVYYQDLKTEASRVLG